MRKINDISLEKVFGGGDSADISLIENTNGNTKGTIDPSFLNKREYTQEDWEKLEKADIAGAKFFVESGVNTAEVVLKSAFEAFMVFPNFFDK